MKQSRLVPFVRENIDILFVGLNPATISSEKGHYFSVKQSFWKQLYISGLITENIDKDCADMMVFGTNQINYRNWNYGITDLVTEIAESQSQKIKPTHEHCINLYKLIKKTKPRAVVLLHGKVQKKFLGFLKQEPAEANFGLLGHLIPEEKILFCNIAFPHGNAITDSEKVEKYKELKEYLESH